MQNIGLYTQMGLDLARQGHKRESLPYLRYAVTHEPVNAEVWLWLAHVTPDTEEYRHCVRQALTLDPLHPTALRMKQDLDYQGLGVSPAVGATQVVQTLDDSHKRVKRLRRIILLVNMILAVLACGVLFRLVQTRLDIDALRDRLPLPQQNKTVQFAVGEDALAFRVDVPESWVLADVGSATWQAERDRLAAEFPAADGRGNRWAAFQSDPSEATANPNTGRLNRPVTLLETRSSRLADSGDAVPRLQLVGLELGLMRDCEALNHVLETTAADSARSLSVEIREQPNGYCMLVQQLRDISDDDIALSVHRLYLATDPDLEDSLFAIWELTLPETLYDAYEETIALILDTLQVVESE